MDAAAAVDAQDAPTAACKTRGRVSHSAHTPHLCPGKTKRRNAATVAALHPTLISDPDLRLGHLPRAEVVHFWRAPKQPQALRPTAESALRVPSCEAPEAPH